MPTSVAYDLERSMYFWVDEVLNVFVLGKPSSVSLYPGTFLDVKSPRFLKVLKHSIRSICIYPDTFLCDSLIMNHEST